MTEQEAVCMDGHTHSPIQSVAVADDRQSGRLCWCVSRDLACCVNTRGSFKGSAPLNTSLLLWITPALTELDRNNWNTHIPVDYCGTQKQHLSILCFFD